MNVLLCHNFYQQPGGEDLSFAIEADLLESHGHRVIRYTLHNDQINDMSGWATAWRTVWNGQSYRELRALIQRERPDVMHCMNTFPLISPAAYYAARREGVPVVQSLRNYRLLCPKATFMRDGQACEDCLDKWFPWPAAVHGCYRDSRPASTVVASMLTMHRAIRTWTRVVDMYHVLTEFSRKKFIQGGLPAEKVAVKPNFLQVDPGVGQGLGRYAIFVGRLAEEKGINTLLSAWSQLKEAVPLKIVGDGPLSAHVRQAANEDDRICWLGQRTPEEVSTLVGDAACLLMPSVWYEGFPRTILEAFAKGTPVIASRLGSMVELIHDGRTGVHFEPGNSTSLAAAVRRLWADGTQLANMRLAARREFENKYTAEPNYRLLVSIYERAFGRVGRSKELVGTVAETVI